MKIFSSFATFAFFIFLGSAFAATGAADLESRLRDDEGKAWNILYPKGADITKESPLRRQQVKNLIRKRQFAEYSLQKALQDPSEFNLQAADATIDAYEYEIKKSK